MPLHNSEPEDSADNSKEENSLERGSTSPRNNCLKKRWQQNVKKKN